MNAAYQTPLKLLFALAFCVLVFWAKFAWMYNIPGQEDSFVIKPFWFGGITIDAVQDERSFFSPASKKLIADYDRVPMAGVVIFFAVVYYFSYAIVFPTLIGQVEDPVRRRKP
ncbi:MAG: hypothetical protein K8I02_00530 [Candidatus Methylomirabilis sp.]|nr:hypothetical protein [Deltaproteobacteria bacterium]